MKSKLFKHKYLLTAVAVLAIAVIGSSSYAVAGSLIQPQGSPEAQVETVDEVPAQLESSVHELNEPTANVQKVEAALKGLDDEFIDSNGMNLALSNKVESASDTYLVAGNDVLCVADGDNAHCTPDEYVGKDFEVRTACEDGTLQFEVSGVVTDGFTAAHINRNNGGAVDAAISDNFLTAAFTANGTESDLPGSITLSGKGMTDFVAPLHTLHASDMQCS